MHTVKDLKFNQSKNKNSESNARILQNTTHSSSHIIQYKNRYRCVYVQLQRKLWRPASRATMPLSRAATAGPSRPTIVPAPVHRARGTRAAANCPVPSAGHRRSRDTRLAYSGTFYLNFSGRLFVLFLIGVWFLLICLG